MHLTEFDPDRLPCGSKYRISQSVAMGISVPVLVARGVASGAVLVVTSGVHGDEYEGVRAIFELFNELDPSAMRGDFIAVPIANPPAFWGGTRISPIDQVNLARVFPGRMDGTVSEQLASFLSRHVISRASFYLDLHSAGLKYCMPSMVGFSVHDSRSRAAAETFGASVIWGHATIAPGRTISFAEANRIPWLYTEARGAGRIHPADLDMMKRGIRNLLCHLEVLDEDPQRSAITTRLVGDGNIDAGLVTSARGFLLNRVRILDRVEKGDPLGALVDTSGETIERYRAPRSAVVTLTREFPVIDAGEIVYAFGEEEL